MFVNIIEVNGKKYKENKKEVRKGIYIPDCFENEAQYDKWFNEVFTKYKFYHLRKYNTPIVQDFESLKLTLKFS